MGKESLFKLMEEDIKVNLRMIRAMGRENLFQQTENLFTREIFQVTCKMELDHRLKLVCTNIQDSSRIGKRMVKEK